MFQVPHKVVQEKPTRIAERAAVEFQKKNQNYQLLSDDDDDEDDEKPEPVAKVCCTCGIYCVYVDLSLRKNS